MDKIKKALDNLDPESVELLLNILDIKAKTGGKTKLLNKLYTLYGINSLLSSLSEKELMLFSFIADHTEGVTYGEIEKNLQLKHEKIEEITNLLKNKLLVYVYKNRRHLTKKLDKIYIFEPYLKLLNRIDSYKLASTLEEKKDSILALLNQKVSKTTSLNDPQHILEFIYSKHGIITFNELLEECSSNKINEIVSKHLENGNLEIYHYTKYPFNTFLVINDKVYKHFYSKSEHKGPNLNIQNNYLLINNILNTFDIISTHGLFLTQQNKFRKLDNKRISDSVIPLSDLDGRKISREETSQLAIYMLDVLQAILLKKDSIFVSFDNIKEKLTDPFSILEELLKKYNNPELTHELFSSPYTLPDGNLLEFISSIFSVNQSIHKTILQSSFFIKYTINDENILSRISKNRTILFETYENAVRFLLFTGILNFKNDYFHLSDIGTKLINRNRSTENKITLTIKEKESIYINPDFTLIIPKEDILSQTLYSLLAYTEVIKNDIVLHVKITKDSILKAYKRGMDIDHFINELKQLSKNEIPQNLNFLLKEWIEQTLNLQIGYVTLLKVNHPSFLDELSYDNKNKYIIEKLSDKYALINREHIEEITKLAEKHNAIITLSDELKNF